MVKLVSVACGVLAVMVWTGPAMAQQGTPAATAQAQNIQRIPLQRFDVPGTAYETVIGMAAIAPNVSIGRHVHPGVESGYVIEGSAEMLIDGQPPRLLEAGDSYVIPARTVHDAKAGPEGARVIATYVVEKGKPLASPVD